MTDPKNVPLAEARRGDIVHPRAQVITGTHRGGVDTAHNSFAFEDIDHIERAPRVQVGDRVKVSGWRGNFDVLHIHGTHAWVSRGPIDTEFAPNDLLVALTYLEPVE